MEMSSGSSLWRLYPKRSIASHSICGSGRLFPGLERETRRAESMTWLVTELMVAKDNEQSEPGKDIPRLSRCQEKIAKSARKARQSAKLAGLLGQPATTSAEYALFFGQSANTPILFLMLKRRCRPPPAQRCLLPASLRWDRPRLIHGTDKTQGNTSIGG